MNVTSADPFRLILDRPGNGRKNMAVDDALLSSVGKGSSPPTIRLYGFSPPTVSLGRFQRIKDRIDFEALEREGATLVRRPTGGQAVLHDHELTYAVVLGRRHLEPFGKREIYRFIAGLLLLGLERLGIRGHFARTRCGDPHHPDCFRSTGEYEIATAAERKLIGSAQLVNREGSLQHGAIPFDDSYKGIAAFIEPGTEEQSPEEPGSLGEELGRGVGFDEACKAFAEAFAVGLGRYGIGLQTGELKPEENELAGRLLDTKYARDQWNLMY